MAKRRFSVRIKIVVPPGGLGQRHIQGIFLRRGTDGSQTRRWRGTDSNFRFPERSVKRQGRASGRSRILFLVRLSPVRLSGNCLCWHQTRKT